MLPCFADVACVVSIEEDSQSYIAPIAYHIDRNQAKEILLKVLPIVPRGLERIRAKSATM